MALPKILKHMSLFNDGHSYQGQVGAVTVPKLARKMEAIRMGGMEGPVKVDLGMSDDGIQIEWTLGGLDETVIRQYAASKHDAVPLRFVGSYQRDDTGEVVPVEVVARGRHEEIDFGEAKSGELTEHKIVTTCSYYKLVINGTTEVEIDIPNFVSMVNGVDMLAEHRAALGI